MFFEHELLDKGAGFRNISGQLYPVKDNNFPNSYVYSSPYGQWVYDSSISGANIPSGIYANNIYKPRSGNSTILDFEHGRVISNTNLNQPVTAVYAVKDFNVYSTSKTDAELVYAAKNSFRPEYGLPITGLSSDNIYGPSVFIKRDSMQNDPFAFGGQDMTELGFRCVVLTNNEYDLDAVGSIFTDAARKNFLLMNHSPLNRYGDIANSGNSYNYLNDVANNYDSSKLIYIKETDYYRFDSLTETKVGLDLKMGFIEFKLSIPRFPRI